MVVEALPGNVHQLPNALSIPRVGHVIDLFGKALVLVLVLAAVARTRSDKQRSDHVIRPVSLQIRSAKPGLRARDERLRLPLTQEVGVCFADLPEAGPA